MPTSPPAEATARPSFGPAATLPPTAASLEPSPSREGSFTYAGAVAFWNEEHGLAGLMIGEADGSSRGELELTMDGGRSWATAGPTSGAVAQVAVVGSVDAWALTRCQDAPACGARLYRSTDSGASWTSAGTDLTSISFVNSIDGWGVAGGLPSNDPALSALERTRDGGFHWARLASPCAGSDVGLLRAVSFRSATSGLVVCAMTLGAGGEFHAVLATNDAGSHWTTVASTGGAGDSKPRGRLPYGGYIRAIVEARDGTAWISGDRMVPLASHDRGVTWEPLGFGDSETNLVSAAWPLDAQQGAAVVWVAERQATLVEVTSDGGRTWTERSLWPVG